MELWGPPSIAVNGFKVDGEFAWAFHFCLVLYPPVTVALLGCHFQFEDAAGRKWVVTRYLLTPDRLVHICKIFAEDDGSTTVFIYLDLKDPTPFLTVPYDDTHQCSVLWHFSPILPSNSQNSLPLVFATLSRGFCVVYCIQPPLVREDLCSLHPLCLFYWQSYWQRPSALSLIPLFLP